MKVPCISIYNEPTHLSVFELIGCWCCWIVQRLIPHRGELSGSHQPRFRHRAKGPEFVRPMTGATMEPPSGPCSVVPGEPVVVNPQEQLKLAELWQCYSFSLLKRSILIYRDKYYYNLLYRIVQFYIWS